MKKSLTVIIVVLLSVSHFSTAQEKKVKGTSDAIVSLIIPQEELFIHINTNFLITGETLFYKIYCMNKVSKKLSEISKMAYVELIDPSGNPVFKHKIRLSQGIGYGDYFLPNSLFSGNYKLIGYTQWMYGSSEITFFENNISIVNPKIEGQQKKFNHGLITIDTLKVSSPDTQSANDPSINSTIKIALDKNRYSKREKVNLNISSLKGKESFGKYSISIRKKDTITTFKKYRATAYSNANMNSTHKDSFLLPEMRGELIKGQVKFKNTNTPAQHVKVALSIPQENFIFSIANTNQSGVFFFNVAKAYENIETTIQVIEPDREKYEVIRLQKPGLDYKKLNFLNSNIPGYAYQMILNKSIYTQIENAYKSIKPDSLMPVISNAAFYESEQVISYHLDDYTRFPTMREVVVEILKDVWISEENNAPRFHVRLIHTNSASTHPPLVLIDGQYVFNHEELIYFDAKKIKKIMVMRNNYYYGSAIFQGVISVQTYTGNYQGTDSGDYVLNFQLDKPTSDKIYYKQRYDEQHHFSRIPDYRSQLLWEPNLNLVNKDSTLSFYTSDVEGVYEICMEGFTNSGIPISVIKTFHVK